MSPLAGEFSGQLLINSLSVIPDLHSNTLPFIPDLRSNTLPVIPDLRSNTLPVIPDLRSNIRDPACEKRTKEYKSLSPRPLDSGYGYADPE
jgi:hypothetical protein